jgi:hypothetical protein
MRPLLVSNIVALREHLKPAQPVLFGNLERSELPPSRTELSRALEHARRKGSEFTLMVPEVAQEEHLPQWMRLARMAAAHSLQNAVASRDPRVLALARSSSAPFHLREWEELLARMPLAPEPPL